MSAPARPAPEQGAASPRRDNGPFSRANLGATLAGGYLPLILALEPQTHRSSRVLGV